LQPWRAPITERDVAGGGFRRARWPPRSPNSRDCATGTATHDAVERDMAAHLAGVVEGGVRVVQCGRRPPRSPSTVNGARAPERGYLTARTCPAGTMAASRTPPGGHRPARYIAGDLSLCETRASCPYARIQAQGSWSREAGTRSCGRDGRRIARGAGADCCS